MSNRDAARAEALERYPDSAIRFGGEPLALGVQEFIWSGRRGAFVSGRTVGREQWGEAMRAAEGWLSGFLPMEPDDRADAAASVAMQVLVAAGFIVEKPWEEESR